MLTSSSLKGLPRLAKLLKAFVLTKFNSSLKVTEGYLNIDVQIESYIHT